MKRLPVLPQLLKLLLQLKEPHPHLLLLPQVKRLDLIQLSLQRIEKRAFGGGEGVV